MANDINWEAVKQRYVEGATWDELKKEFGVATGTIHNHSKEGNWAQAKIDRNLEIARGITDKKKTTIHDLAKYHNTAEEAVDQVNRIVRNEVFRITKEHDNEKVKLDEKRLLGLLSCLKEALGMKHSLRFFKAPESLPEADMPLDPSEVVSLNGETPAIIAFMDEMTQKYGADD